MKTITPAAITGIIVVKEAVPNNPKIRAPPKPIPPNIAKLLNFM